MSKLQIDRVGEEYTSKEGYCYKIVAYDECGKFSIQFEDGSIQKGKIYSKIVEGQIKNLFHKSTFGVGYFGEGTYKASIKKKSCVAYIAWNSMMNRCYGASFPSYQECSVAEEWHNYQNFAKWHEENFNEDYMTSWQLDKDILKKNNKIYSPDTCTLVPRIINNLFENKPSFNGGVQRKNNKFTATSSEYNRSIHLGIFDCEELANIAYEQRRRLYFLEIAEKYRDMISDKTYRAIVYESNFLIQTNKILFIIGEISSGKDTLAEKKKLEKDLLHIDLGTLVREKFKTEKRVFDNTLEDYFVERISETISKDKRDVVITGIRQVELLKKLSRFSKEIEVDYLVCPRNILKERYKSRAANKDKFQTFEEAIEGDNWLGMPSLQNYLLTEVNCNFIKSY